MSSTIYTKLDELTLLINEWVSAGNPSEFAEKKAKIVIILDNTSFHKKEEYLEKIETELPNIHLEFLPELSLEL